MTKYFVAFCALLTMVSCVNKTHEGTTTAGNEVKKKKITVAFRELPIVLDLPSLPPHSTDPSNEKWVLTTTTISTASDKLLAGFEDYGGFLKNPLYNNWKTVGPLHNSCGVTKLNSSCVAKLVEVSFDGPRPFWFTYEIADEIMSSARYDHQLGLHDLANLVSKYGDALPADTPIVGFASVTAYYSYARWAVGKEIKSPVVMKTKDGKWNLLDLEVLNQRSYAGMYPYQSPLFLVDVDMKDSRQPLSKVEIFIDAKNVIHGRS